MRILFVNTRPPWPGRRGDQARTAGFVGQLKQRHEIRVLAQRWPSAVVAAPPSGVGLETVPVGRLEVASRLALGVVRAAVGGGRPLQSSLFDHASFRIALRRQVADFRPEVVVLVLGRLGHLVDDLDVVAAGIPVVIDLVDALSLNFEQRARREHMLAWLWRWESRRLQRWDAALAGRVAALTVVAERDRAALVAGAPSALRAVVEERTQVVPFGLPIAETDAVADEGVDADPSVVLTGNLGYFPTVDGALHFARHVWPAVRRKVPDARWLLAGSRPARAVRALAALPGVEVVAEPDDLERLARQARVAIAPMRSGSGTPIKILEAMSWRLPVVATRHAAAGLDELPPEALAVADRPADFARWVSEYLTDPSRARQATEAAAPWLRRRHSLDASASRFERLLESVIA